VVLVALVAAQQDMQGMVVVALQRPLPVAQVMVEVVVVVPPQAIKAVLVGESAW
jgi:hypothetical protein